MKKFSIITQQCYKITACSTYAKSDSSLVCPKGSAKTRFFHAVQCCQSNSDSKIQILSKKATNLKSIFQQCLESLDKTPKQGVFVCACVHSMSHDVYASMKKLRAQSRTHAFHRKNYRCYSKVFENQVHSNNHP